MSASVSHMEFMKVAACFYRHASSLGWEERGGIAGHAKTNCMQGRGRWAGGFQKVPATADAHFSQWLARLQKDVGQFRISTAQISDIEQ